VAHSFDPTHTRLRPGSVGNLPDAMLGQVSGKLSPRRQEDVKHFRRASVAFLYLLTGQQLLQICHPVYNNGGGVKGPKM